MFETGTPEVPTVFPGMVFGGGVGATAGGMCGDVDEGARGVR